MAFEYLVEGRDGGSTVLRFVHAGFLGDDWEAEYDALRTGDRMYLRKLALYRTATYAMFAAGPQVADQDRVWAAFTAALGLTGTVAHGDPARLAVAGVVPVNGVVEYADHPSFLGVRTGDGLYDYDVIDFLHRLVRRSGPRSVGPGRWASVGDRRAGRPADGVEVPQRLGVGGDQRALVVGDAMLLAERPDERSGPAQAGPWHAGEQVVLDLVVQAAEQEVDEPAAPDVARGQHLAPEEVQVVLFGHHRHAFVVRRERAAQVQAEQALLDGHEGHRLHRREHQRHGREVAAEVHRQQRGLRRPAPDPGPEHRPDAGDMQGDRLEQGQREEEVRLVAGEQPTQPTPARCVPAGEHDPSGADVRIPPLLVRVAVVPVVLADPPVVAQPDQ